MVCVAFGRFVSLGVDLLIAAELQSLYSCWQQCVDVAIGCEATRKQKSVSHHNSSLGDSLTRAARSHRRRGNYDHLNIVNMATRAPPELVCIN